jgi:hypothetical protein
LTGGAKSETIRTDAIRRPVQRLGRSFSRR